MSTTEAYALPLTLGQQFRDARKRAGLDQDQLGAELGVNRTTISRWERDLAVPPFDAVATLSRLSGWSLELFARAATPVTDGPETPPTLGVSDTGCNADVLPFRARRTEPAAVANFPQRIAS